MINEKGNYTLIYSDFKLFAGLATAALIAFELIVSKAMINANNPAPAKTHQLIAIRYAKSCNHLFMAYHATGKAISQEIIISFKKSLESMPAILPTDAPKTFLMPISLVRCSAA